MLAVDVCKGQGQGVYDMQAMMFCGEDADALNATVWREVVTGLESLEGYCVACVDGKTVDGHLGGNFMVVKDGAEVVVVRNDEGDVVGLKSEGEEKEFEDPITVDADWEVAFRPLELKLVADLKFAMMLTGRDHGSSHYCVLCKWKHKTDTSKWTRETLEAHWLRAQQLGRERWSRLPPHERLGVQFKGGIMLPKNLKVENICFQVLHVGIGLNNDGTGFTEEWFKKNVECRSVEFLEAKASVIEKGKDISDAVENFETWMEERSDGLVKGDRDHQTVMARAWDDYEPPLGLKKRRLGRHAQMPNNGFRWEVIGNSDADQARHFADRNEWARRIEELEEMKRELPVLVKKEKDAEKKWVEETPYSEQSGRIVDNAFKLINVQRECFNGKQLNGMQGRQLQHKSDAFIAGLEALVLEYMVERDDEKMKMMSWAVTEQEVKDMLRNVGQYFKLLGLIMTTLRSVAKVPQDEIDEFPIIVEKFLKIHVWMRKEMGRKEESHHKSHLLRDHAHEALDLSKCLGRDAEDPIEGSHNAGNILMRKNMSTKDPHKFMSSIMNDFYAANIPVVRRKVANMRKATKRNFSQKTKASRKKGKQEETQAQQKLKDEILGED